MNEDTPEQIDFWVKRLWDYFEKDIRSGLPVYLCLDSQGIKQLAENYLIDIDDAKALEYFHTACNTMFINSYSERAMVRPEARCAVYGPYSAAICLAVQQVLVVEDMIDDQYMSYDSYFPRYRQRLGLGPGQHSNPLSKDDFESIWFQLRCEMLSIEGASEKTITFRPGTGRKNITRNYPLSQSLLSTRDLYSLRKHFVLQRNIDADANLHDIQRFFFTYRTFLTRRGRRVIQNDVLIRKVVDQFRTFLKSYDSEHEGKDETIIAKPIKVAADLSGTFVISTKIQGFRERYSIRYKVDFDHQHYDRDSIPFLDNFIQPHSAYIFSESTNGYTFPTECRELRESDQFIMCYKKDSNSAIDSFFTEHVSAEWRQVFKPIELLESSDFTFTKCTGFPADWPILNISGGKIVIEQRDQAPSLSLQGGLQINKLKGIFLDGYPPNQLSFGGIPLTPRDVITANGIETTVGKFLQSLKKKWGYRSFHLDYSGIVKEFAISNTNEDNEFSQIGFPKHDNVIYPIAQPLTLTSLGLCGWMSINDATISSSEIILTEAEIAWLARIEDKAWIRVNNNILDRVVNVVDAASLHFSLKNAIICKLIRIKKLPIALVSRHFSAG